MAHLEVSGGSMEQNMFLISTDNFRLPELFRIHDLLSKTNCDSIMKMTIDFTALHSREAFPLILW